MHYFKKDTTPCMKITNKHDDVVQLYKKLTDNSCDWVPVLRKPHCAELVENALISLEDTYHGMNHRYYKQYIKAEGLDKNDYF